MVILDAMLRIFSFGEYLKKIRGKVSQKDFAESIGLSQNSLSYLENGKREPSISLLFLLQEKKGIDIQFWFSESEGQHSADGKNDATDSIQHITQSIDKLNKNLSIAQLIVAIAQIRAYLSELDPADLPESDRRTISDLLAACQRVMDSNELPDPRQGKNLKAIND